MNLTKAYTHLLIFTIILSTLACNQNQSQLSGAVENHTDTIQAELPKDYFEVTNEIYATVFDSVGSTIHYDLRGLYCGPRIEDRQLPAGSTFRKPFSYTNLIVQKNTDPNYPSQLYRIHLLNDNTIQINYGLYCLPRIIYRKPPPPPDNRPRPFLNISFDCAIRTWQSVPAKAFIDKQQSATKTAYVSVYPYLPHNTSYKVTQWAYKSTVKVFKAGALYREYEVSNKIPNLTKVHSSFSEEDRTLLVEIIE